MWSASSCDLALFWHTHRGVEVVHPIHGFSFPTLPMMPCAAGEFLAEGVQKLRAEGGRLSVWDGGYLSAWANKPSSKACLGEQYLPRRLGCVRPVFSRNARAIHSEKVPPKTPRKKDGKPRFVHSVRFSPGMSATV